MSNLNTIEVDALTEFVHVLMDELGEVVDDSDIRLYISKVESGSDQLEGNLVGAGGTNRRILLEVVIGLLIAAYSEEIAEAKQNLGDFWIENRAVIERVLETHPDETSDGSIPMRELQTAMLNSQDRLRTKRRDG